MLSGVIFAATLVSSSVYVSGQYGKTFISLWLVLVLGAVCGVFLSLLLPKAYRLNVGVIVLFAALAMALFFAVNNNFNVTTYQTEKVQIAEKSTYIGRDAKPYVSIDKYSFHKQLSVQAPADVVAGKYVILKIKKGCFGYKFIDSYQLMAR